MDRRQIDEYLKEDIVEARLKISKALLLWENAARRESSMPALPTSTQVWLPTGPDADLKFITFIIWSLRYKVSIVWLLNVVLGRFRGQRRLPPVKSPEELSLGMPAALLVSDAARRVVEERLAYEFPNHENMISSRQPRTPPMPDMEGVPDLVSAYVKAVRDVPRTIDAASPRRAYRGSTV